MSRAPMKLILTHEVGGLGAPGDVVDVAPGYGRNYLIPRGFAMPWTRGAEKQIDLIKRARSAREVRGLEDAQAIAAQLSGLRVRMRRRAGASGRLFGSVGSVDIAAALRKAGDPATGVELVYGVCHALQCQLLGELLARIHRRIVSAPRGPSGTLARAGFHSVIASCCG